MAVDALGGVVDFAGSTSDRSALTPPRKPSEIPCQDWGIKEFMPKVETLTFLWNNRLRRRLATWLKNTWPRGVSRYEKAQKLCDHCGGDGGGDRRHAHRVLVRGLLERELDHRVVFELS